MNGIQQRPEISALPDATRAKAAAWIAQLHDETRGPDFEVRLRAWLGESEDHRRAFAGLTRAWDVAGEIRLRARTEAASVHTLRRPRYTLWAAALAATFVLVTATIYYWNGNAVVTEVGERRVQMLRDGTRVILNTNTRIEIDYDEHARRVRLVRGEAWFDVSKRPAWPFLVSVDGKEIRALGTSFVVRRDGIEDLSVTLIEGRISVASTGRNEDALAHDSQILDTGQRLIISAHRSASVDRPDLSRITAWQHGRVEFEATSLADAVNEMNRYSKTRVIVAGADIARLPLGGVFHAGNSEEFVRVVTAAFGLQADRNGADIVLSRPPAAASSQTAR